MNNIDKVTQALGEWGFKVASSALPQLRIPSESPIGKFMYGILGVDPKSYNIWEELGFLAEPAIQSFIAPMASKLLSGMPDEQIKEISLKFVDSFIERAREREYVNVFGVSLGESAFEGLKSILTSKFES